jgi:hypothetical protein
MPRRNRRAEQAAESVWMPQTAAPIWALAPGYEIRRVSADKEYRCPGCDHLIRRGLWHLVVVPEGVPDERRHWHERCWRIELRAGGRR